MDTEWLQLIASVVAAIAAVVAWHAARINAMKLDELYRQTGARWADSLGTVGREQRAIGKVEGGRDERLDHEAELERTRVNSLLVTELPSEERRADETK